MNRFLVIIFVLVANLSVAQNDFKPLTNSADFEQKAQEAAKGTTTIVSDFTQIKHLDIMEEDITSSGKFHFRKEADIRWEYTKPYEYLIILNNEAIHIKDDENENTINLKSNKMFKNINKMIVSSVQGDILSNNQFKASFFHNSEFYKVNLIPMDEAMKSFLNEIEIYFSKTDYSVESIKMIELSDDYTKISFQNREVNTPIADDKFSF